MFVEAEVLQCPVVSTTDAIRPSRTILVKGNFIAMRNQAPRSEDVWESGGIAPCILNICTRSLGMKPRLNLNRSVDGLLNRSGRCEEENRPCLYQQSNPCSPLVQPVE
jgi:hypothetical protein